MIISRTPFRISFVRGGTDLRAFYQKEFGQVLSTTIDKYIYVVVKRQTDLVEFKYRINWSKVEFKRDFDPSLPPVIGDSDHLQQALGCRPLVHQVFKHVPVSLRSSG